MIKYDPTKLIKTIMPPSKIKRLLTKDLNVKRAALSFIDDIEFLDKKKITSTALKVVKNYKARVKDDTNTKSELKEDPKLLIQRVENEVVKEVTQGIREKYEGEFYIWTPSDAEEPDPEHQLNYGKKFRIGDGEMPGDRDGCRCGMDILVDDKQLEL
jgi:hypothetical protein